MSIEIGLIIFLLLYILFLQYQIHRKNQRIENFLKKQQNIQNYIDREDLDQILTKLKNFPFETFLKPSKLFEEEVLEFIFKEEEKEIIYVHYTKDLSVAQNISKEGFQFAESFYKTAELVINDKLDLIYKHNLRKQFGRYVIVLAIAKDVYNMYMESISMISVVVNVEQVLSIKSSQLNDNEDEVYLLPHQFVKGFIDSETGEIFPNPTFSPNFSSPQFEENIRKLKGK
jgi:Ca2+/Na+ antiporter